MIDEHLVDRERNVMLSLEHHDVVDFLSRHLRNLNLLDDQLAPADGDRGLGSLDPGLDDGLLDGIGHGLTVADGAIGDRVRRQADRGHPDDARSAAVRELDDLDGARADIQAERVGALPQLLEDVQHVMSPVAPLDFSPIDDRVQRPKALGHAQVLRAGPDRQPGARPPDRNVDRSPGDRLRRDRRAADGRPATAAEAQRGAPPGDDDDSVPLQVSLAGEVAVLDEQDPRALDATIQDEIAADEDEPRILTRAEIDGRRHPTAVA